MLLLLQLLLLRLLCLLLRLLRLLQWLMLLLLLLRLLLLLLILLLLFLLLFLLPLAGLVATRQSRDVTFVSVAVEYDAVEIVARIFCENEPVTAVPPGVIWLLLLLLLLRRYRYEHDVGQIALDVAKTVFNRKALIADGFQC